MWRVVATFIAFHFAILNFVLFICTKTRNDQRPVVTEIVEIKKKPKQRNAHHHKKRPIVVERTITLNMRPMTMDEEDAAGLQTFIDGRKRDRFSSDHSNVTTFGDERASSTHRRRRKHLRKFGVPITQTADEETTMQNTTGNLSRERSASNPQNASITQPRNQSLNPQCDPHRRILKKRFTETDDEKIVHESKDGHSPECAFDSSLPGPATKEMKTVDKVISEDIYDMNKTPGIASQRDKRPILQKEKTSESTQGVSKSSNSRSQRKMQFSEPKFDETQQTPYSDSPAIRQNSASQRRLQVISISEKEMNVNK